MAKTKEPEDEKDSVARDMKAMKEAEKASAHPDEDRHEKVDLDADDDDDDDDDEEPARAPRSERRRQRRDNLVAEAKRAADEANRRAENAEREARHARELADARRTPEPPKPDPHDKELDDAYSAQQALADRFDAARARHNGSIPQDELKKFLDEGRAIEQRKYQAIARKEMGSQKQLSPEEVVAEVRRREIVQEHNDVISNAQAFNWVRGKMQMEIAGRGRPDTKALMDEVMDEARALFGMTPRNKPAPSDAQRRRLSGGSRGAGATREEAPRVHVMTKDDKRMADASYPHIKDKAARYKKWARETYG